MVAEAGLGWGGGAHSALDPSPPSKSRDPWGSGDGHGARGRVARAGGEMLQGGAIRPHAAHLGPRPLVPPFSLLAAPDCPPCLRPRPGAARPGSARPRRPRCSARSACAAAAAAPPPLARPPRSRAPGTPFRPRPALLRPPAAPAQARPHTGAQSVMHRCTRGGPEVASHTATHSHGVTHSHTVTHTGSHTASQTLSTFTHSHNVAHTGSHRVIQTHSNMLTGGHTLHSTQQHHTL